MACPLEEMCILQEGPNVRTRHAHSLPRAATISVGAGSRGHSCDSPSYASHQGIWMVYFHSDGMEHRVTKRFFRTEYPFWDHMSKIFLKSKTKNISWSSVWLLERTVWKQKYKWNNRENEQSEEKFISCISCGSQHDFMCAKNWYCSAN